MKLSNGTSTHDTDELCKFILKPIQNSRIYGLDKIWPSSVTLTLGLHEKIIQMAHLHLMENHCQIILKSSTIVDKVRRTDALNCCFNNHVSLTAGSKKFFYFPKCFSYERQISSSEPNLNCSMQILSSQTSQNLLYGKMWRNRLSFS